MRFTTTALLCITPLLIVACRDGHAADDSSATAARADSVSVTLPANSAQLKSLTVVPVRNAAPDSLRVPGRVTWNDDVTVRVFSPFAGRVERVLAAVGRHVAAGDTLALIAAPDYGQAQADARRAAADLQQAERASARATDLVQHGVAAKKEQEAAEADVARARTEADRANLRLAQYGGGAASVGQAFALRAPIAGTVVDRSVSAGQEVRPDQMLANAPQLFAPLFVITDPAHLWVQLDLPEHDLGAASAGTQVTLHAEALPKRAFSGTIDLVASAVDPNTRTVKARAVVNNDDGALKSEMLVSALLPRATAARTLEVPAGAVLLDGTRHVVYVADGAGRFRRQTVDVGNEHAGFVAIRDGLTAGDRVVSDGAVLVEQLYRR